MIAVERRTQIKVLDLYALFGCCVDYGYLTVHHRKPRCRRGGDQFWNYALVPNELHQYWHSLFGGEAWPHEIGSRLTDWIYLRGRFGFRAVRIDENCRQPLFPNKGSAHFTSCGVVFNRRLHLGKKKFEALQRFTRPTPTLQQLLEMINTYLIEPHWMIVVRRLA